MFFLLRVFPDRLLANFWCFCFDVCCVCWQIVETEISVTLSMHYRFQGSRGGGRQFFVHFGMLFSDPFLDCFLFKSFVVFGFTVGPTFVLKAVLGLISRKQRFDATKTNGDNSGNFEKERGRPIIIAGLGSGKGQGGSAWQLVMPCASQRGGGLYCKVLQGMVRYCMLLKHTVMYSKVLYCAAL